MMWSCQFSSMLLLIFVCSAPSGLPSYLLLVQYDLPFHVHAFVLVPLFDPFQEVFEVTLAELCAIIHQRVRIAFYRCRSTNQCLKKRPCLPGAKSFEVTA